MLGGVEGTNITLVRWDTKVLPESQGLSSSHQVAGVYIIAVDMTCQACQRHWGWGNKIHGSHCVWFDHHTKTRTAEAGPLKPGTLRVPWNSLTGWVCLRSIGLLSFLRIWIGTEVMCWHLISSVRIQRVCFQAFSFCEAISRMWLIFLGGQR